MNSISEKKNIFNNIYEYFLKYILPDYLKIRPINLSKQYALNFEFTYKKLSFIYTNPKFNPITKKLEFGSFEQELQQGYKKPPIKYYNPITDFYLNKFNKNNKFSKTFKITNPKYNIKTKKLEFNYIKL